MSRQYLSAVGTHASAGWYQLQSTGHETNEPGAMHSTPGVKFGSHPWCGSGIALHVATSVALLGQQLGHVLASVHLTHAPPPHFSPNGQALSTHGEPVEDDEPEAADVVAVEPVEAAVELATVEDAVDAAEETDDAPPAPPVPPMGVEQPARTMARAKLRGMGRSYARSVKIDPSRGMNLEAAVSHVVDNTRPAARADEVHAASVPRPIQSFGT